MNLESKCCQEQKPHWTYKTDYNPEHKIAHFRISRIQFTDIIRMWTASTAHYHQYSYKYLEIK